MSSEQNILYLVGDKDIDKNIVLKTLDINDNIYKISTKYYKTSITIKSIDLDKDNTNNKHLAEDSHGFILAFDSSKSESFEFIKQYIKNNKKQPQEDDGDDGHDDQEEYEGDIDDTLYLLIDINESSSSAIEDKIEEWCIEHLIEFVILDTASHRDYDIRKSELTETDPTIKYGVERVQEILESNMWPNMDLLKNDEKRNKNQQQQQDDDEFSSIKDNKYLQESLKKVELLFKKSNNDKKETSDNSNKKQESKSKVNNNLIVDEPDNDEEDDVEIFENTFKELQSLREHMKNLPDDQRRDMAAKVALMFAKNLSMGEDDEDDF
ncbi:hypothetical protein DICPUDRAFT_152742 [Dictyostelium purpureum]|uniref:Uncharacterized protein n=1 Tax=Dictyostelium purpureum TaxID=5786 RepID=F0ZM62_DICPU|nr:uncharacterized protein DICPUDRAFT_152742 [Dictyostelium purpureum]EGC34972.1 hypothetical protein DICPUDRAFT_152742 [Dictyostelium purpureum]|eukprot:XP_003288497.1 hypothetical protein DICPUDRAFT_152742 [Dictyostelium purpureum]